MKAYQFIDKITPSDIAFVISVLKNGHEVWDQNIKMMQLGEAVHGERLPLNEVCSQHSIPFRFGVLEEIGELWATRYDIHLRFVLRE
jgi:hypothetical protein